MRRVFTVAWLAILLGFAIEALLLAVAAVFGGLASVRPFVADLVRQVSWSLVVCAGIGVGTAAATARPAVMGFLGLLSASAAFILARSLHQGASAALGLAVAAPAGPAFVLIAGVKAVEYALFGMAVAWLSKRGDAGLRAYVLVGFAAGAVFGGLVLALMATAAPLPAATLLSRAVDEILFPVGCALVIWVSGVLTQAAKPSGD